MEWLQQVGLFFSQTLIIVLAIIAIIITIAAVAVKNKNNTEFEVDIVNDKFQDQTLALNSTLLSETDLKSEKKKIKAEEKQKEKNKSLAQPRLFVLNFLEGDIKASQVEQLREEITAILLIKKPNDEVVINIESPGGAVHGYGLAASQIMRLKKEGLRVTVCVDKIAASGGYMMACVGDKVISAPFAIIGSIGVVAQVPNFNRLLKKHEIDYKEYTAGDFKRTVSLFGEITPKGEKKFEEQLESTHLLFKNFVQQNRPQLNIDDVATGEYWLGQEALKLNLVDEIGTSDDFILSKTKTHKVIKLSIFKKARFSEKLGDLFARSVEQATAKTIERLSNLRG